MQLEVLEDAFDAMAYEIDEGAACSQGLELRYPLFNHKIIQLAFSTPRRPTSRGRPAGGRRPPEIAGRRG